MRTLVVSMGIILLLNFVSFGQDDIIRTTIKKLMPNTYAIIADEASKEWADNFEMQKFVIEKQCAALLEITKLTQNAGIPEKVFNNILFNALKDWCQGDIVLCKEKFERERIYDDFLSCLNGNWEMILFVMNNQIKAYKELQ